MRPSRFLLIAITLLSAGLVYLLAWPVPVQPVAWQAPEDRGLSPPFAANDLLADADAIDLGEFEGPEDVVCAFATTLYAGASDGTILRIDTESGTVAPFTTLAGRPLGIETDADGSLLVANAYVGIQRISPEGKVTDLLTEVDGEPLVYADDIDVAADGTIYFSEASTKFGAEAWGGSYAASLLDIMEHGGHGRVIAFDPASGNTEIIVDGLNFANGVALGDDDRYLLIVETGSYRILRHWLLGPEADTTEVIIDNLPGFPDNINNGLDGAFWIGLVAPREARLDALSDQPFLRKIVQRLPAAVRPKARPSSHVIAIDGDGTVLANLQDRAATFASITGACETPSRLYLTRLFGHELPFLRRSVDQP